MSKLTAHVAWSCSQYSALCRMVGSLYSGLEINQSSQLQFRGHTQSSGAVEVDCPHWVTGKQTGYVVQSVEDMCATEGHQVSCSSQLTSMRWRQ